MFTDLYGVLASSTYSLLLSLSHLALNLISAICCRSKTIQNLPPALFTLMKSTEPHSDLYYQMDIEAAMRDAGFLHVETWEADHRHRAVLGLAPPQ